MRMSRRIRIRCACGLIDADRALDHYGYSGVNALDLEPVVAALADQGARQVVESRWCCGFGGIFWWFCIRSSHRSWMVCPRCEDELELSARIEGEATIYPVRPEWRRPMRG